jgi:hypothetical protein
MPTFTSITSNTPVLSSFVPNPNRPKITGDSVGVDALFPKADNDPYFFFPDGNLVFSSFPTDDQFRVFRVHSRIFDPVSLSHIKKVEWSEHDKNIMNMFPGVHDSDKTPIYRVMAGARSIYFVLERIYGQRYVIILSVTNRV